MTDKESIIAEQYTAGLQEYLGGGEEAALQGAYELGREAVNQGVCWAWNRGHDHDSMLEPIRSL